MERHTYTLPIMQLSIQLIHVALIGFRATTRVWEIFSQGFSAYFSALFCIPSWKTTQNWYLRFGLHKLTRPKIKADDWIYIYDFKVLMGVQKVLIILGVRLSQITDPTDKNKLRNVTHEDCEPLAIVPMVKSNGQQVYKYLDETASKTGVPLALIRDGGADIEKGGRLFIEKNKSTVAIYDTVHKLAILLGNEIKNDDVWSRISEHITMAKQKTKQSPTACLAPPKQREKSRLLNMNESVSWLIEIYLFLNSEQSDEFDSEELVRKLGWVLEYPDAMKEYEEIMLIIEIAKDLVRTRGIHRKLSSDFRNELLKMGDLTKRAFSFASRITKFFKEEGKKVKSGLRLLGSSEVIESVIGRYKLIEERSCGTRSVTPTILAIGALVGEITPETIKKALEETSTSKLREWCHENIGETDCAKRRRLFAPIRKLKKLIQPWRVKRLSRKMK